MTPEMAKIGRTLVESARDAEGKPRCWHQADPANPDECLKCKCAFQDPATYEPFPCEQENPVFSRPEHIPLLLAIAMENGIDVTISASGNGLHVDIPPLFHARCSTEQLPLVIAQETARIIETRGKPAGGRNMTAEGNAIPAPKIDVSDALKKATRNRSKIEDDAQCGCYQCLSIIRGREIREWTDNGETAICPKCGVDSIIPGTTDETYLKEANTYWFH